MNREDHVPYSGPERRVNGGDRRVNGGDRRTELVSDRQARHGRGSTYLITGGAGFLGSHLVEALVSQGKQVMILDDLSTGSRDNVAHLLDGGRAELIEGSVLDVGLVNELMPIAHTCFHLASPVGVELVVDRPLETTIRNVRGTDIVTAAAAEYDARLLFASTSEVYGKQSGGSLREDSDRVYGSVTKSRWGYAAAKVMGEMLVRGYHAEQGTETMVVRLFNTIGPRQQSTYGMVVPRLISQALAGEDLTVYGDGEQSRCFTHVKDVVDALLLLVANDDAVGHVFNVGSRTEVKVNDLARRVIARTKSSSQIRHVPYAEAYGDGFEELGRRRPDTTALQQLTGWEPRFGLDDAIDDILASLVAGREAVG
jgi:UDP-glucose 4-epimerase